MIPKTSEATETVSFLEKVLREFGVSDALSTNITGTVTACMVIFATGVLILSFFQMFYAISKGKPFKFYNNRKETALTDGSLGGLFNPSKYGGCSEKKLAVLRKAYLSAIYHRGQRDRKRKLFLLITLDCYQGNDMEAIETYMKAYSGE